MALVVEDGTGVVGANSYCSLDYANDYFDLRNNVTWGSDDASKAVALIKATDYIELRYADKARGQSYSDTQGLTWPRTGIGKPSSAPILPEDIKKACCEYAIRAMSGELVSDLAVGTAGLPTVVTKQSIAGISKEFKVIGNTDITPPTFRSYPSADFLMKKWIKSAQSYCFV